VRCPSQAGPAAGRGRGGGWPLALPAQPGLTCCGVLQRAARAGAGCPVPGAPRCAAAGASPAMAGRAGACLLPCLGVVPGAFLGGPAQPLLRDLAGRRARRARPAPALCAGRGGGGLGLAPALARPAGLPAGRQQPAAALRLGPPAPGARRPAPHAAPAGPAWPGPARRAAPGRSRVGARIGFVQGFAERERHRPQASTSGQVLARAPRCPLTGGGAAPAWGAAGSSLPVLRGRPGWRRRGRAREPGPRCAAARAGYAAAVARDLGARLPRCSCSAAACRALAALQRQLPLALRRAAGPPWAAQARRCLAAARCWPLLRGASAEAARALAPALAQAAALTDGACARRRAGGGEARAQAQGADPLCRRRLCRRGGVRHCYVGGRRAGTGAWPPRAPCLGPA
jgi:hypothetical protein